MNRAILAAAGLAMLGGCSGMRGEASADESATPPTRTAMAELRDATGNMVGMATAAEADGGLSLRLNVENMAPGVRGAHVHMSGKCDAPKFETAGGHWNPSGAQHGRDNPAGMHAGDLPNIEVGQDGRGTLEFSVAGGTLASMMDADGAAVVVHAKADDYRTDPSGNSGDRVACGVFR